jgi:DNA invertase Pin-like site-specific DNA recombinase
MAKYCGRYHRFSDKDQSTGSIERQDMVTNLWCENNDVVIQDTFNDDGYSAKNFDRPDVKKLFDFCKANRGKISYLVVAELTRFSRMLGDAINMVTKIQNQYGIKIVSAGRGMIYDVRDSASFFMMSIEFAQGNCENIQRESNINGGIYVAKAKEGRYIGAGSPVGYKKIKDGKIQRLIIDEDTALIVRYIYHAYLHNEPVGQIRKVATEMGFKQKGNSSITKILKNPIYVARQYVKAWKEMPGGMFPAANEPIVDLFTWNQVQDKLKGNKKKGFTISDNLPLRGVLNCYCGKKLTGAASRGRHGEYYDYYKGKCGHLNISAITAHKQLQEVLQLLSLPEYMISAVKETSLALMDDQLKVNKKSLQHEKNLLEKNHTTLVKLEEKWILNQVRYETYQRWFADLTQQIGHSKALIEKFSRDENEMFLLLDENLEKLSDMQYLYNVSDTSGKQEMIRIVFDQQLYYRNKMYRTPYLMDIFHHNILILKQKQLLELDEKRDFSYKVPSSGAQGRIIEPLTDLLSFVRTIRVA